MSNCQIKNAFTLAETLVTLGIIGIVASMTLPSLINKTQSKQLEAQFKKVYTELNQVAQLYKKDNGISITEAASENGTTIMIIHELLKYYKGASTIDNTIHNSVDNEGKKKSVRYNIYSMGGKKLRLGPCDDFGFFSEGGGRIYSFVRDPIQPGQEGPVVCVDINGFKGPNKYGYDIHVFYFTNHGYVYPMGQPHLNKTKYGGAEDASSSNFFYTGSAFCKYAQKVEYQMTCANYALQNKNPQGDGNYWQDFLGKNK